MKCGSENPLSFLARLLQEARQRTVVTSLGIAKGNWSLALTSARQPSRVLSLEHGEVSSKFLDTSFSRNVRDNSPHMRTDRMFQT